MGIQERKIREKQARQEAILQAARQVFFAKGLDQTTIDDIAEAAELSKGTIYLYFKSKEEVYVSVFLEGLAELTEQFEGVRDQLASECADEALRRLRDIFYRFFIAAPEYFYINSLLYHGRIKEKIDATILAVSHEHIRACLDVVTAIIRQGTTDGRFRAVDAWKTACGFWGAATGIMMIMGDKEHQSFVGVAEKELLDETIDRLIAGISLPTTT